MGANTYYLELMFIFLNVFQLQKSMKKGHTDRDLIFEEKRQEALEKRLGRKFIRTNTSKRCDEDYEIGRRQTFISKFKNKQLKKNQKKNQTKK